jgi:hypothetical protein
MRRMIPRPLAAAALLAALLAALPAGIATTARADEGMWTLDNLPLDQLEKSYGFRPTPEWLEHVQKACVDFGGGSGAFVSPTGLLLTNHHVALGQLQKMSSPEHNYVRDGFYARSPAEEKACPDLELRVLMSMEDVTDRVRRGIDAQAPDKQQNAQRKAATADIEKAAGKKTGLQARVVELYRGGEYWLYLYKKYTDVRLVMAPEERIAFYGGDWDNFCYPRHDLDFAFFRAYENGRPVRPERWLVWSAGGPKEDEFVVVAGHPGSTGRQLTVAQLEYQRDANLPVRIRQQERRLAALRTYAATGPEPDRRARDRIRGLENNLKRQRAYLGVLQDPAVMERKRGEEARRRERVAADPALAAAAGDAWDRIAAAQAELMKRHREYLYRDLGRVSRAVDIATQIVRYAAETAKPNEQRLAEYRDSNLESLRFRMFSPAPIYPDVEAALLAAQLEDVTQALGPDDPFVKAALGGRWPAEVAADLTQKTQLGDVAFRKQLVKGGRRAIAAATDPLIAWVRAVDPLILEQRRWFEDTIESVESREGGALARARFALDGKSAYPDATGTLRLSPGKVAGYEELTTQVPWKTTFYGLFDRAASFDGADPFDLPRRIAEARDRLDLTTPLNFVSTNDIIGGNSGSPVVSRDLELVGLVFDGNTQAFCWNYYYEDVQARCVSVHSSAILEALRKIYDMGGLADELAPAAQAGGGPR